MQNIRSFEEFIENFTINKYLITDTLSVILFVTKKGTDIKYVVKQFGREDNPQKTSEYNNRKRIESYNEYEITKQISKLYDNNISKNSIPIYGYFEVKKYYHGSSWKDSIYDYKFIVMKFLIDLEGSLTDNIKNDIKTIVQPNIYLMNFAIRHFLYISYKLMNFVHGDIENGKGHNIMLNLVSVDNNVSYIVFIIKNDNDSSYNAYYIFKKKNTDNIIPFFTIFDYGFSEIGSETASNGLRKIKLPYPLMGINPKISLNKNENLRIMTDDERMNCKRNSDIRGINLFFANDYYRYIYTSVFNEEPDNIIKPITIGEVIIPAKQEVQGNIQIGTELTNIGNNLQNNSSLIDIDVLQYDCEKIIGDDNFRKIIKERGIDKFLFIGESDNILRQHGGNILMYNFNKKAYKLL
jgi:hypothetical protein